VRGKGLAFLRDMIRRDRNHPSVLTWSVSNELPTQMTPGQERYLTDAAALAHREDPSRLVAFDFTGYPSLPPEEVYKQFDAIGANAYYGWYHGPNGQTEDRDLLGPYLDQLHQYYPRQALFVTEFGAEANRDGPPNEKGTYAFQTGLLESNLRTDARKPFLNGAVVWLLRDFAVRPGWDGGNPHPTPPVNAKGLVNQYGQKKPAFGAVAAMFARVKALR
jgi:beta-glucuronidase